MAPFGCPEPSVTGHQLTLRTMSEDQRPDKMLPLRLGLARVTVRGSTRCDLRSRKRISCVPRCLLHVCHIETRPNLLNRSGSEPTAQRGTPPHKQNKQTKTHTIQSLRFWRFRRPRIPEIYGIS